MKKKVTNTILPHKSCRGIGLMCLVLVAITATGSAQSLLTKTGGLTSDPSQAVDRYGAIGSGKGLSLNGEIIDAPLYTSITGCYAKISATVYKDFLCHNLGANTSLDPHIPVVGLQGASIQWGRRGPNTTGDSSVDWQTAGNTANFATAPTDVNANANAISGWSTTAAANGSWAATKTVNDPCPTGYQVPTSAQWAGVNSNNIASRTGTFTNSTTYYGSALHYGPNAITKLLTLPAAGNRNSTNGTLGDRGRGGYYWSSTANGTNAFLLDFNSGSVFPAANADRKNGFSLRCIAVDNPSSNGTAVASGYTCNTASGGTMVVGSAVSGVTQTITATVTTVGTYGITATANGVTFEATGTFAGTGAQNIVLTASGTPTFGTASPYAYTLNTTPNCSFTRAVNEPSSNGSAVVSAYNCNTASAGTMAAGLAVSGVTQTITATITTVGTFDISTTANGVTFAATGTFAGTGAQNIVLTATGTPTVAGSDSFTLNTTPNCSFSRTTITVPGAPTSPAATVDNDQATVAFTAPGSNGGSDITGYTVTSSPGSFSATGASSPLVVTGLTNGTSYTFTVIATNAAGNSVASAASAAVTPIFTSITGCYAKISATVYKDFLCHNLGADTSLDPHIPVVGLQGAYIQWGRRGPNTTGDARVDWQTAANTPNFAAAPTGANAGNANAVTGWSTAAGDNSWRTAGGAKTLNDPCPSGFRVPTQTEWAGVISNNIASGTGTFALGNTEYGSARHYGPNANTKSLTLPATGRRDLNNGALKLRGSNGYYWSSTESGQHAFTLSITVNDPAYIDWRRYGFSLRCIAE
jgi:uncharacterized protein (TIGR02145 family)